jgi:hypothetical protein
MPKFWRADNYHMRPSIDETLNSLTESNYSGQFRFEKFQGYGALPEIIVKAAEEAGHMVLGYMFNEINQWGKGSEVQCWCHRARRDERDEGLADVSLRFQLRATAGWQWWKNIDRHLKAFEIIINHMRSRVLERYPNAKCWMTHDMGGGYDFHCIIGPSLPYGMIEPRARLAA